MKVIILLLALVCQFSFAQIHESESIDVDLKASSSQMIMLEGKTYTTKEYCTQGDWLPSCTDLNCSIVQEEQCETKEIKVCDAYGFNCRIRTEQSCYPVDREVCNQPNPCSGSGGHYEDECSEVKDKFKSATKVSLQLEIQNENSDIDKAVKLNLKTIDKGYTVNILRQAKSEGYLILSKLLAKDIITESDSEYSSKVSQLIKVLNIKDSAPKVKLVSLGTKSLQVDTGLKSDLNVLPFKINLKVMDHKRKNIFFQGDLNDKQYTIKSDGVLNIEFWRLGITKTKLRKYIVKATVTVNQADVAKSIIESQPEGTFVLNKEIINEGTFSDYSEGLR